MGKPGKSTGATRSRLTGTPSTSAASNGNTTTGSDSSLSLGFKNGNLVRLSLRDFMTYKKVEMKAGPNLNLVLGPNGTGKSALVCAVIIGLGGEPSTTGRSGHLGEYIRFGCNSALVEIELYNDNGSAKNHLIQRVIQSKQSSSGKTEFTSSFKLNGKEANRTTVREFTRTLNINVDNLCQFLPQERVVEFVKMDRKTLLECTEKAAGDEHMYDSHVEIVKLTKQIKKLNDMNADLSDQITSETAQQQRAEEELRRIEERDKYKDEISWLARKRPWIEYEDKRVEYMASKEQLIAKKEEMSRLSKCLEPLKTEVNAARKAFEKCQILKNKAITDMRKVAQKVEPIKNKIEKSFEDIKDAKNGYFEKEKDEKQRLKRMETLRSDLNTLEEQYACINEDNSDDLEDQIKGVVREMNGVNEDIAKCGQNRMKLKNDIEKMVFERNQCDSQRKALEDVFRRRLDKLRELDPSAARAYEWLKENENRFTGRIYPPIMTQINMNRIEWAKYVESAISKNDLISFICENGDDLKIFTQCLKQELNIRVNVVLAPTQSADSFVPNFEISSYKRYGIFATIKDMFTAPDKVMAFLCKSALLHNIPVGDHKTEQSLENLMSNSNFRRLYTDHVMHVINVSRYDNQKVTHSQAIPVAKYLNLTIDEKQLADIKQKIIDLTDKITDIRKKGEEVDKTIADLNDRLNEMKNKKRVLENKKNEKRILETKMAEKREQISRLDNHAIDLATEKPKVEQKLQRFQDLQLQLMAQLVETVTECAQLNQLKLKAILNETLVMKRKAEAEKKLANASNQFNDIKEELKRLERSLDVLKRAAKELRDAAKEISGFDVNNCSDEVRQRFDAMPNTVEEIDNQSGTLRLRMNSILDADDSVRDQYNERRRNIEKRRRDLDAKKSEMTAKQRQLDELKDQWLPALELLIDKINKNFGNFMARLNCAGEVALFKPNDLDQFDEYGISIKVKFRETEQLRELTSFHQSGGERSVSTMIYMIAIQELTKVPFRCVDEINQGMDENNERSVFDLISETSSSNNSQYFLFSPKLLSDLKYTQEMTIHIIFNGPHMEFDWSRMESLFDEEEDE